MGLCVPSAFVSEGLIKRQTLAAFLFESVWKEELPSQVGLAQPSLWRLQGVVVSGFLNLQSNACS